MNRYFPEQPDVLSSKEKDLLQYPSMGALPKRRISTGRAGRRRQNKGVKATATRLSRTTKRQRRDTKRAKTAAA